MADAVFLDTSGLLALIRIRDELRPAALQEMDRIAAQRTPLVTSEWVLTELLNSAARPPLRQVALQVTDSFRALTYSVVVSATTEHWSEAYELFRERSDKEWSLVDCSSILLCQQRGIHRVFTHDRHFEQAGFEALLR